MVTIIGTRKRAITDAAILIFVIRHFIKPVYHFIPEPRMDFTEAYDDRCSSVGHAAKTGDEELLARLIGNGSNVDIRDNRGWTPLHEAAAHNHIGCVQQLLQCIDKDGRCQGNIVKLYIHSYLILRFAESQLFVLQHSAHGSRYYVRVEFGQFQTGSIFAVRGTVVCELGSRVN